MIDAAKMWKLVQRALLIPCVLAGCMAWAQPDGMGGPPPGMLQQDGPRVDQQLKQLTQLLALTTDQQTKIRALLNEQQAQAKALFDKQRSANDNEPPTPEAMEQLHTALRTLHSDTHDKIAALLNDAQKSKYEAWSKKHGRDGGGENEMPPPPEGGPDGGPGGGPNGGPGSGMGSGPGGV